MAEFTKFQQNAIKNFYDNRDSIALQRVQELVTELYLSEGKKLQKNWDNVILHLSKLNVDKKTLDHLRKEAKPELVASLITRMLNKQDAPTAKVGKR
jgi:hypothetical protein